MLTTGSLPPPHHHPLNPGALFKNTNYGYDILPAWDDVTGSFPTCDDVTDSFQTLTLTESVIAFLTLCKKVITSSTLSQPVMSLQLFQLRRRHRSLPN